MPKKFLQKFMPDHDTIRNHKHLKIFGTLLHSPNLFHLNRRSVAGAFANGLFNAFIPVPFQMILAAAGAILFKVNLPLSIALVWVTNPLTMAPIFYGAYKIGAWLMGTEAGDFHFELTTEWLMNGLAAIWQPFLLGCFVSGTVAAILGYLTIRLYWRYRIVREWRKRNKKRAKLSS
ncbi:MAG: DUF2062 domain-containing protein [Gammaproteobacteria bacterium]|nr:DUF2062 domain-containing protein [Gammaproteobacteria bacterium]